MTLNDTLINLYKRDLEKLKTELAGYASEADLWKTTGNISNSAGNLALHLNGNLQHFIGAILGDTGYVRNRDAEFSDGGISRDRLSELTDETIRVVEGTLSKLTEDDYAATYPIEVFGEPMTTEYFLIHLATHLDYHLGQINYHRRLLASG